MNECKAKLVKFKAKKVKIVFFQAINEHISSSNSTVHNQIQSRNIHISSRTNLIKKNPKK